MRKAVARIFAFLAIGVCAFAIYSVVHSNLHKSSGSATTAATTTTPGQPAAHHHHTPYTVKSGDTLSAIAHRHHVTVAQIRRLNSGLSDQTLQPGRQIQLR